MPERLLKGIFKRADTCLSLIHILYKAGGFGMSAVVPVITAGVAYSIADRPGIAPGLILGFICTEIKAGFIGGIVAGFLVGYLVLAVKKYVKLPSAMQGLSLIHISSFP